jgi:hypothetical protein
MKTLFTALLLITLSCSPAYSSQGGQTNSHYQYMLQIQLVCEQASVTASEVMMWRQYDVSLEEALSRVNEVLIPLVHIVYQNRVMVHEFGKEAVIIQFKNAVYDKCVEYMVDKFNREAI